MKSTDLTGTLRDADALLVVPPFAATDRPCLGVHVLQACAREAGFDVPVLYANILFAREIGEETYRRLCYAPLWELIGEKIFADSAFGSESPATALQRHKPYSYFPACGNVDELIEMIGPLQSAASEWADKVVQAILPFNIPVTGCNNSFAQISSSVALLNRIKAHKPDTVTIAGGANCEGEMAEGILSLAQSIDYVFSGECEQAFPEFLDNMRSGNLPADPVVRGTPCSDLDGLPATDFGEYFDQTDKFLPRSRLRAEGEIWLSYESSRGCWWAEKHQCRFCGLSGKEMKFREKSPDRVAEELSLLIDRHPADKVFMTDNIISRDHFETLIPKLGTVLPKAVISYKTRSDLSFEQVAALKKTGRAAAIEPGIEALSTDLLRLMNKGVTAGRNIALLRFARSVGLPVIWGLLHCFPGDSDYQYESVTDLLPLLCHLTPPISVWPMIITRFSPYFNRPGVYGIDKIRPMRPYASVFPGHADLEKLACHFEGDFESAARSNPGLIRALEQEVRQWRARWEYTPPELSLAPVSEAVLHPVVKEALGPMSGDAFILSDTRCLPGTKGIQVISHKKALAVIFGGRNKTGEIGWALENFLCAELDSQFVPLATCSYEVYAELRESRRDCL